MSPVARMMSAGAAKTWWTSRPPCAVVSSRWCSEVKPVSRLRGTLTMPMRPRKLTYPAGLSELTSPLMWCPCSGPGYPAFLL
jgi:hypothetical protein